MNRFFSLHYCLPFIILGLVVFHLVCLHNSGSNNPLGLGSKVDTYSFTPFFFIKDFSFLNFFLLVVAFFVFFAPNYLGHPDNYILADPLVTPNHIVPEWYFLPFYAVLRAMPDKLLGTFILALSILVLLALPFFTRMVVRGSFFSPLYEIFFWVFVMLAVLLGWLGGKPIEAPYYFLGQCSTFGYFFYFLVLIPLTAEFKKVLSQVGLIRPLIKAGRHYRDNWHEYIGFF